jgi:hypothetical protein
MNSIGCAGPNQALIEYWAPEMWLDHDEDNFPSTVELYLQAVSLWRRSPKQQLAPTGLTNQILEVFSANNQTADDELYLDDGGGTAYRAGQDPRTHDPPPPVYAHVRRYPNTLIDIQYWFFYPYNGPAGIGVGAHPGDWEHVTVRVDRNTDTRFLPRGRLVGVLFSAHDHEETWTQHPQLAAGANSATGIHPVAYVAHHSHANYGNNGQTYFIEGGRRITYFNGAGRHVRRGALPDDWTSTSGVHWQTWRNVIEFAWSARPSTPLPVPTICGQDWCRFTGRWGPTLSATAKSPTGPAMKASYKDGDPNAPSASEDAIFRHYPLSGQTGRVTNLLAWQNRMFAAAGNEVWELDLDGVRHHLTLSGVPTQEPRLAATQGRLWVGHNGYIYPIEIGDGLNPLSRIHLEGREGPTNLVTTDDGRLFVGAQGRVYEIDTVTNVVKQENPLSDVGPGEPRLAYHRGGIYVGIDGRVYALPADHLGSTPTGQPYPLEDRRGITNVAGDPALGVVYAAAGGRAYRLAGGPASAPNTLGETVKGEVTLAVGPSGLLYAGTYYDDKGHDHAATVMVIDPTQGFTAIQKQYNRDELPGVLRLLLVDNRIFAAGRGVVFQCDAPTSNLLLDSALVRDHQGPVGLAYLGDKVFAGVGGEVFAVFSGENSAPESGRASVEHGRAIEEPEEAARRRRARG